MWNNTQIFDGYRPLTNKNYSLYISKAFKMWILIPNNFPIVPVNLVLDFGVISFFLKKSNTIVDKNNIA